MEKNLVFVRVLESNVDELSKGMSELYFAICRQRRDPAYWRRCYLDSPVGKGNLIVAIRGSQVVGMYGLSYLLFIVRGELVVAGLMEDVFVHPFERSWRRYQGLVQMSTSESLKDSLKFRFGISPFRLIRLHRRLGVINLGRIPVYLGFLNIARILEERRVPSPLSKIGWLIQPILGLRINGRDISNLDIRSVENFGSAFDELWSTIAKTRTVTVVKNAAYLNWRYVKCPGYWYGRLAAYQDKRLEGLIVFCTTPLRRGSFMLELLVRGDNPEIMKALLLQALRQLRAKDAAHVTASFPVGSQAAAVLKELGFKSWGTKLWSTHLITATDSPRKSCPELDLESWDLSFGDWAVR